MTATLIGAAVAALVLIVLAWRSVQIIPQAHAAIIERVGRYRRTLGAGLHLIVPGIDRRRRLVDLREQVVAFPPQPVITRRNQVGSLSLEEVLTSRERVDADLRHAMDEATGRWGIRVNRIELKSIDPPAGIKQAMEKQMRAERDRRAAILAAEGEKQSAILVAEGEARARVLAAEAEQRAAALEADGERQAIALRARGDADAVRLVMGAVRESAPTPEVLSYLYMQVLPEIAGGRATTLIVPSDTVPGMGAAAALGEGLRSGRGPSLLGEIANGAPR